MNASDVSWLVDAHVDGPVPANFIEPRSRRSGMLVAGEGVSELPMFHGKQVSDRLEHRVEEPRLVTVAKWRDGRLQIGVQFQPEM